MADSGNVQYLDTKKFSSTISTFKNGIEEYNRIRTGVKTSTNTLFNNWQGEGKKQFEKDYTTIYQQLTDIGDIMYELYDSLIDAQAAYIQADEEAAKMNKINSKSNSGTQTGGGTSNAQNATEHGNAGEAAKQESVSGGNPAKESPKNSETNRQVSSYDAAKLNRVREDRIMAQGSTYWKNGNYYKNGVYNASQCLGYAKEVQERVYGRSGDQIKITSFDEIQPGDVLCYDSPTEKTNPEYGHSVFVIGKTDNGELIVTGGNEYPGNIVNWDRKISRTTFTPRHVFRV